MKNAEYSLAQAFYNTAGARSAFYPALSLSGTLGWTNDATVLCTFAVALRKESVDRNFDTVQVIIVVVSRSPQGERG